MMGVPWDKVVLAWGDTSQNLPWTCVSGGSQTTHAMTRAARRGIDAIAKAQEIAAKVMGGSPAAYKLANERISVRRQHVARRPAKRAIAMGGKFDGHELPENINKVTVTSATALAGQGLMGVARDTYKRDGTSLSFVAGFAEVEVDVETGAYRVVDYTAIGDSGTIIHPRAYMGQLMGRSVLGMGHALAQKTVYDQHYGLALATRMYQSRPPTILDIPRNMKGEALNIPDPETPVGARGIGEPPVAAGACSILNAPVRRARRRHLPARAGDTGHDPHGARARAADAGSAHGQHLRNEEKRHGNRARRDSAVPVVPARQRRRCAGAARGARGRGLRRRRHGLVRLAQGPHQADERGRRAQPDRELQGIRDANGGFEIGAMTTLTEIAEHAGIRERFGILAEAAGLVASPQIRNQGTLGGNISQDTRCWALPPRLALLSRRREHLLRRHADGHQPRARDPRRRPVRGVSPSDTAPALIALDAQLVIRRRGSERVVAAADYFWGRAPTSRG